MATWYVDLVSGNDSTGDGSAGNPYKTEYKVITTKSSGDEIRVAKTAAHTSITDGTTTWTNGSTTVNTSVDLTAQIAVGDYIGRSTASGNGSFETFYRVSARDATTITLENKYYGTTGTDETFLKMTYVRSAQGYGTVNQNDINNINFTISGGWNLTGTPARDGQTFAATSFARNTGNVYYQCVGTSVLTLSYMNIVDSIGGCNGTNGSTVNNCTFNGYNQGVIAQSTATSSCTYTDCVSMATQAPTYGNGVNWTGTGTWKMDTCYINSKATQFIYMGNTPAEQYVELLDCVFYGSGTNIFCYMGTTQGILTLTGTNSYYVTTHINVASATQNKLIGGTFNGGTNGVSIGATQGLYLQDFTTNGCTYGVTTSGVAKSFDIWISGHTSNSDGYGLYNNVTYTRIYQIYNCSYTTPTNYAIYLVSGCNPVMIQNCTIDLASQAKFFYNPTGTVYTPRAWITGGTNVLNGIYYNNWVLYESTVDYRTEAPSYEWVNAATIAYNVCPVKVWNIYALTGNNYTVTYYLKKSVSWTGTITPVLSMFGRELVRGTPITSLTASYVQYSIAVTSASIPTNGDLELGLVYNGGTSSFFIDDFDVTIS